MESAIDKHLVCPRTIQRTMKEGYVPPYPAWTARTDTSVTQVVMGYFGVQFKDYELHGKACMALDQILRSFAVANGPKHIDIARFKDAQGFENMVAIAYWKDPVQFNDWQENPDVHNWWNAEDRLNDGIGYFREVLKPRMAHFETAFSSSDILEGVGVVMGGLSDEIQEHAYWGGMRDRIPLAQTDQLNPVGFLNASASGKRVRIAGHENLAVIRSGQDWVDTNGKERDLYIKEMEPTLHRGMDFLHTQGRDIGCYANRYMQHIDSKGQKIEKSFGLSYWRSLANLEAWAKSHPTHVAIFGT
ncbi:MAG TPA: phenylacetaldoxime dehydratase family protein, partial [Methyloradius sp.]